MGLFKNTKNMIQDAKQMQADAQAMVNEANQPIDPNDPVWAPIEGITLDRYAEISAALARQNLGGADQVQAWVETQGVAPGTWQAVQSGGWGAWGRTCRSAPATACSTASIRAEGDRPTIMLKIAAASGIVTGAAALRNRGVSGQAVVKAARDTGERHNMNPVYELALVVTPDNGRAYDLSVQTEVNTLAVTQCVPGTKVAVKVDPDDHTKLWIDWLAVAGGAVPTT